MKETVHTPDADLAVFDNHSPAEGPALLFLPGWCSSHAMFDPLVEELGARHRTLRMDWRGHGASGPARGEFGADALVDDAMAVIEASGAREVVPVATAHAGWVAIELRRRLGARVPKIVLLDWLVLDPPPPFLAALDALKEPSSWQATRDQLFAMWLHGVDSPRQQRFVHEDMGAYDGAMWRRAGREILGAYRAQGNPLLALAALQPPPPTLHLYASPDAPAFYDAQRAFSAEHPFFRVSRLHAKGHFAMLDVPAEIAAELEAFLSAPGSR